MQVCMLSRSVLTHGIGGMERHIDVLCRELAKQGHSVTVVTTALNEGGKAPGNSGGVMYMFTEGTEPGKYSRAWWSASRKALAGLEPDIVHSQSIGAYGVLGDLKKRKLPMVATSHGTPLSDTATALKTHGLRTNPVHLFGIMSKMPHHMKVYGEAKRVIAVSRPIAEHLVNSRLAPSSKIDVILNGVDTDFFCPPEPGKTDDDVKIKSDRQGADPVIFSIARVVKDKGFHFLISAMPELLKEHPEANLVIGGDGPYLPELRKLAGKLGLEGAVRFRGQISEEQLRNEYRECDLFALATTFVEGFGLVLAEAMACGKPAAASRIGGVTEVIRDGKTGRLFEPGEQKDITRTLLELLSDLPKLRKMGEEARKDTLARFSASKSAEATAAVYAKAIASVK
jgi:glycosyltransferase involved in cell wall biosynthesis